MFVSPFVSPLVVYSPPICNMGICPLTDMKEGVKFRGQRENKLNFCNIHMKSSKLFLA